MPDESSIPVAFDEQRALEELEKLRGQILRARAERDRVDAEFDAFIRGFRSEGEPRPPHVSAAPEEPIASEAAATHQPPAQRRRVHAAVVVTIAATVLGAAVFAVHARRATPSPPEPTRTVVSAAREDPAARAEAVQAPPSPAPVPAGVDLELLTRRRVWMRVTIDGRRAFEREVAADQRIPLRADRTIVIRAGDAGAVAVTRDGRDAGLLGRDGMIATREFTALAAPVR